MPECRVWFLASLLHKDKQLQRRMLLLCISQSWIQSNWSSWALSCGLLFVWFGLVFSFLFKSLNKLIFLKSNIFNTCWGNYRGWSLLLAMLCFLQPSVVYNIHVWLAAEIESNLLSMKNAFLNANRFFLSSNICKVEIKFGKFVMYNMQTSW